MQDATEARLFFVRQITNYIISPIRVATYIFNCPHPCHYHHRIPMTSLEPPSNPPTIHGLCVTSHTQCSHWHSPLDIIAIKHACCNKFYACISCHNACETHVPKLWEKSQREEKAALCGQCKHVLSVNEYMGCGGQCTECGSAFNPGCVDSCRENAAFLECIDAGRVHEHSSGYTLLTLCLAARTIGHYILKWIRKKQRDKPCNKP
ncbi:zf-CHY-domain-containing protein [Massarina eburnea CBS 473.64]|uniref:Zf-CHY-domain-containing protein n=1 Tax=Massarina eburnea CBS 473.64 TaxID=1395130 RepID=A0A6A6SGH0_9PLEO|nr:zf-CHY-domain-containing protein [Massarina eburnea CBS 473.64]